MAFSRSVFVLLVLNVVFTCATVPVFMWGDLNGISPKSNPLSTVSEQEFEGILKRELKDDPFVAVFVDESLSVEDFSLKNDEGESLFPYLHENIGDALYLPSVENAVDALQEIAKSNSIFIEVADKGLSTEFEKKDERVLIVSFKDAQIGDSRAYLLRRHNDLIEYMFTKLQEDYDKVVGIYTARYPSWIIPAHSIVRRQVEDNSNNTDYNLEGLRLYVSELILYVKDEPTYLSGLSNSATNSSNETGTMDVEMKFRDTDLLLNFHQRGGYWFFDSVSVNTSAISEILLPTGELHAPMGFSYRCAQNVTFTSGNDSVKAVLLFKDMKIQPFFSNTTGQFGDSINCVGFFSVPIWSGLFVTFILLAITFYGIMMMMDIRTMDRFDDPKGKTITINAGE